MTVDLVPPVLESSDEEGEEPIARSGGETVESPPPPPPPPPATEAGRERERERARERWEDDAPLAPSRARRPSFPRARDSSNSCRRISTSHSACCARSRHVWVLSVGCVRPVNQLGSARRCLDQGTEHAQMHSGVRQPALLAVPSRRHRVGASRRRGLRASRGAHQTRPRVRARLSRGRSGSQRTCACGGGVSKESLEDEGKEKTRESGRTRGRVRACPSCGRERRSKRVEPVPLSVSQTSVAAVCDPLEQYLQTHRSTKAVGVGPAQARLDTKS